MDITTTFSPGMPISRDLIALGHALKAGATIAYEKGRGYVLTRAEETIAASRIDELTLLLAVEEGSAPRRRGHVVKLTRKVLSGFAWVRDRGEGLGAFVRTAMEREIIRRKAELDAELQEVADALP